MLDFGPPSPDPALRSKKAASTGHLDARGVEALTRAGKMRWDEVEQRNVAVEAPEGAAGGPQRAGIVGIRLDGAPNLAGKPAHVQRAMLDRREKMAAAQAQAKAELASRNEARQLEEAHFDSLKVVLEPRLKDWSEEYGKKKNIRALLAGMDRVIWPEANWQPISIADLLQARNVKRAYFKAARVVHPDKLVDLDYEKKFIGRRVFDALAQAYAEFENSGAM